MATRDYSSVYSIKKFILEGIAPKYFDTGEVNLLNVGMVGYTTDVLATMSEDTFNSFAAYTQEIFPNLAKIPETIYNNAARFQIENLFARPAKMPIMLFIAEKDIIDLGENKGDYIEFFLDSDLIIDVDGVPFMMDYDVMLRVKTYRGDYTFSASYVMNFTNSVSESSNPYIKYKRMTVGNQKYIGLMIDVHQVNMFTQTETLINNDKINYPTIDFKFNDQLANFEVFYKPPGASTYTQLAKRLANSVPSASPFCYYKIKDEKTIQISFTLRDNYFQPQFNSEILIRVYTTTGAKKGNFPLYSGEMTVRASSEVYDYNNNLVLFAAARAESSGGKDALTVEELRTMVLELGSTSGAYSTEADLQLYFDNNASKNTDVLFIKRRDDVLERLFSAFSLFKDNNGDIYPTNTLNLKISEDEFDNHFEQTNRYILKPGHLFKYSTDVADQVELIPGKSVNDNLGLIKEDFIYTSPFMMSLSKTQGVIGFYLNTLDESVPLEYTEVNIDSPAQFICNSVSVKRNALAGEQDYKLTMILSPANESAETYEKSLMVKGFVYDQVAGSETAYFDFELVSYEPGSTPLYTFQATLTTDDYMTLEERMRISGAKDIHTGNVEDKLIPMVDSIINFTVFHKPTDPLTRIPHKYDYLAELSEYTMTNVYSSSDVKINFIKPINMMRCRFKYVESGVDSYHMVVALAPFVGASKMKDISMATYFVKSLYSQYEYLEEIVSRVKSNFGVDMKFYNTYGKSKHFIIGDNDGVLNRVNCSFRFKVALSVGTIETEVIDDLKRYTKSYVEEINKNQGYNSIYISNLFQTILNTFGEQVVTIELISINGYGPTVQTIKNRGIDVLTMTNEAIREYVPEYLTVGVDDIIMELIIN